MDLFSVSANAMTMEGVGAAAALFTGLASSAHCALMCGPLACAAAGPAAPPGASSGNEPLFSIRRASGARRTAAAYHVARVGSYAVVGAALGTAGEGARQLFAGVAPVLPWVMASSLVATSLGLGRHLPVPAPLRRLAQPFFRKSATFAPSVRAAAMGAATPLLPCGILYGLFVAAVAAGAPLAGAALMAAFAVGATPALAVVQAHAPLLARYPRAVSFARRAVPVLAALVLVWRAVHGGSAETPPTCH